MLYDMPDSYNLQNTGAPYSYHYDAATDVMRFEVRDGDKAVYGSADTQRSEISSHKPLKIGQTYTLSYRFKIEPGAKNTAEWVVIGQAHATEDPGDASSPPPFSVELTGGDRMRIAIGYSKEPITRAANTTFRNLYTDRAELERGRWYDMRITVKFDPAGNGILDVWRDGTQIVDYSGAIGYRDAVGPYWKNGVYREHAPEALAVSFSNIHVEALDRAP
jgi:hypothetical protein